MGVTRFPSCLLAGALLLASALGSGAHDTWMQPERFSVTPGASLVLDLTSSDGFVGFQTAIKPDRVALTMGKLGGSAVAFIAPSPGEQSLRFPITMEKPGIAVLGVRLQPRLLDLAADKIELYFREIHASDDLREQWEAIPAPKKWRENYVKNAKTFVRVGEPPADDRSWAEPLGLALEIIPERDPTSLKEGDALPVRVLRGGKPLPGFALGYVSAGETREHVAVTDAEGRATAKLDATGVWLVHGTDLRRVTTGEREWDSDFTTMVVEVR